MEELDTKLIKKLADACRKAGIRQFKGYGIEFTLSDDAPPQSAYKRKTAPKQETQQPADPLSPTDGWDSMSDEEKLFFSSGDGPLVALKE